MIHQYKAQHFCKKHWAKAAAGFAPANSDFADRRLSYLAIPPCFRKPDPGIREQSNNYFFKLFPVPCALIPKKSGRRDLDPRPSPWQGDALPLSYSRISLELYPKILKSQYKMTDVNKKA